MADELDGMATFVAVAEASGFRAAAKRLGLSHTAVSQSLRRLQERLGVAPVLDEFCRPFPGYFLYYPQRRQASRVLRALIEHLRKWRTAGRSVSAPASRQRPTIIGATGGSRR